MDNVISTGLRTKARSGSERPPATRKALFPDMAWIAGGTFQMGSNDHYPEEAPAHSVAVEGFWIDRYPVTNAQFSRFFEATGYITVAERAPDPADYPGAKPEMLVPASVIFRKAPHLVDMRDHYNWWIYVAGADWRQPFGPQSSLKGLAKHPVVHVAYEDVLAFAQWAGREIPTEAEWEFAARGGLEEKEFAWGDEFAPDGRQMANTWQGDFPHENTLDDGFEWTAPVGTFPPNGYGLYDMIGNVWEWTSDWYQQHNEVVATTCCGNLTAKAAEREKSFDPNMPEVKIPRRVMKGGSYLCAPNYCQRYRPAARMAQAVDTSTCHLGFRCIVRERSVEDK
jgi:formylglycine-generating enzyme required for sulfatase activity